jgi:hypothetical protein
MQTLKLTLLSVLIAACLGLQLIPRPMNLEFTSLFCFVTGMVFGILYGAGLGASVMFINGFLSPYGPAGSVLPFQIVGMVMIGAVGGLYGKMAGSKLSLGNSVEPLVLGAFLTFVYDVITNVATALFLQGPVLSFAQALMVALVTGAVPSLIHVVWNTFLFGAVTIPLVNSMQRTLMRRLQT